MKANSSKSSKVDHQDAIALLTQDHKAVQKMFKDFEKLKKSDGSEEEKSELVKRACNELTIHAQIEEEIFYPAVRAGIEDEDLMDEAEVEHGSAKDLISQLESMDSSDELYDARFTVLGEYINHHVKEEQDEMFPKAKKAKLDLIALGAELAQRKEELQAKLGTGDEDEEDDDDDDESTPRLLRPKRQAYGRR
jgi:iron-sulfur cluster repair protein YtfE (RIC family)